MTRSNTIERAPPSSLDMTGSGALGEHAVLSRLLGRVLALSFRRRNLIGEISVLRHRHRRRARLQRLLCQLTTQQVRAELKMERQQRKLAS